MSGREFLQKLLDGERVEWKALGEIIQLEKGRQLNKDLLSSSGRYPAYNGGMSYSGFTDSYNYSENKTIISQGGASAGFVNFVTTKFYANAHCYVVLPDTEVVDNRYIYHFLKLNEERLTSCQHGAGIPALRASEITSLKIPIPCPDNPKKSLAIQAEIVRILDAFTELTAELTARKKQYAYYRDRLLTFTTPPYGHPSKGGELFSLFGHPSEGGELFTPYGHSVEERELNSPSLKGWQAQPDGVVPVEWKTLGEVGHFIRGSGIQKSDFKASGVGCIHYGQIHTHYGTWTTETKSFIDPEFANRLKKAKPGDLVIATTSEDDDAVAKAVAWIGTEDVAVSTDAYIFRHTANPKYMSYFFQTDMFQEQKKPYITGTKVRRISGDNLAKILIPIPPLAEQERIVAILDQFDALTNSLTEGLPREIELRQKQYAYYRDLLFSFPKASFGGVPEGRDQFPSFGGVPEGRGGLNA